MHGTHRMAMLISNEQSTIKYLYVLVGVVSDVAEIVHLWGVDLLKLGSNKHTCDTHKLQHTTHTAVLGQAPVYEIDCQKESIRHQFVLLCHFYEPIHQNSAHCVVDVSLQLFHI